VGLLAKILVGNGEAKETLKLLEIMPGLVLAIVIVTPPL